MVQKTKEKEIKECSVDNCSTKIYARGWCRMHYRHVVESGHKEPLLKYKNCTECNKPLDTIAGTSKCHECYYSNWKNENIESYTEYHKQYRADNSEKQKEYHKEWRVNNREKENAWYVEKRKDPQYKIAHNLRTRMWQALNGESKCESTEKLLSMSYQDFIKYLETQFESWMNWDNYGTEWSMDHIEPLCSFDLTNEEELRKAAHHSNIRPLAIDENSRKATLDKQKKK